MIKIVDKLPERQRGKGIISQFGAEVMEFEKTKKEVGHYIVEKPEDKSRVYAGLKHAVEDCGLGNVIGVTMRCGEIYLKRIDVEDK